MNFANHQLHAAFLIDVLHEAGVDDSIWVPRIAEQGDWVVVTADKGRESPRLPAILPAFKVPGVFLSGGLGAASGFEKVRAVITLLPEIEERIADGQLRLKITRRGHGFQLHNWPPGRPNTR